MQYVSVKQKDRNSRMSIMDCGRYKLKRKSEISEEELFIGPQVTLNFNLLKNLKISSLTSVNQLLKFPAFLTNSLNGWVHPTSWAPYSLREYLQSLNSQNGTPSDFAIFFLISPFSILYSAWPVFGIIFSNRVLCRKLRIWWCVHTPLYDVIFTSKFPSCWVAIYWVLRGQLFLSLITSPKTFFSKVRLVSETARSNISKQPISS